MKNETDNPEKSDPRVERTKRDLRRGLNELLQTTDFDKITVKQICEQTSINKMTFYHHYQDKYDLLADIVQEIGKEIYNKCLQVVSPQTYEADLVTMAAELSTEVVEQCFAYKNEINNIVNSSTSLGPVVLQTTIEQLVELLMENMEKLVVFKYPREDLAAFLVGGYSYLIPRWMNKERESREKIKDTFTHIYSDIVNALIIRKEDSKKSLA
ncbi:MAG: TetR/AcrR family transcriptional regulator [Eubacteriales bacterium]|nr:TetR/AcrR family transcriptional regulator [Eubacteriales bacterium]